MSNHEITASRWKQYWNTFENSSTPLALKWTLYISLLIIVSMGLLGSFLIHQQQQGYQEQNIILGQTMVQQLAQSISEPVMADDLFTLELLVKQQITNPLISGIEISDADNKILLRLGQTATEGDNASHPLWDSLSHNRTHHLLTSFSSPIYFQDVIAGHARIIFNNTSLEQSLKNIQNALILTTLLFILVTILLVFPLARKLSHPIQQLLQSSASHPTDRQQPNLFEARQDELGQLASSVRKISNAFQRHVSPDIARHLIEEKEIHLGGKSVTGSVLFCDIVGFTELSEEMTPSETVEILNSYFNSFSLAASHCHGTVDKFIGDCMMVLFSIPNHDPLHGQHAITSAILMQALTDKINQQRTRDAQLTLTFRIGICSGEMLAGNLGSLERMEYTVIGDTVNLAARLCSLAPPGGIVIDAETARQPGVQEHFEIYSKGKMMIRGRKKKADVHQVIDLKGDSLETLQQQLQEIAGLS